MSNPKRTRKEIREAIKKIKIKRELKRYKNKLVNEYKYINNLTKITGLECIDEYTTIMINKLKRK